MRDNLMEKLNKEQLMAVTHKEGPLLIVAGAGTGKTTVIAQRIAYLIEQGKAGANEILALTFTEKAAGEMEERVDRLLPMGYLDLWISTFHSFGERILKEHYLEIGLPGGFKLLNEFEQWALIKKNIDRFDLDYYRPLGNPTKFIHALIKHFSRAKDEDISPAEYLEYANELKENMDGMLSGNKSKNSKSETLNPEQIQNPKSKIQNITNANGEIDKEILEQEISRINEVANAYHVYQQLLLENNALDFGDLINYCLKLFRDRPAIINAYRKQFKYILLDEFQDTNWAQYELIKILAAPKNNFVVVCDDDQAIFRFRGASMSNVLQFKNDYPKAGKIVLIKNYRNRQNILDIAYRFIQLNNPNRLEYQFAHDEKEVMKLNKKLEADNNGKGRIEIIQGRDLSEEISLVLEKIAELKIRSERSGATGAHANENNENSSWNDFAILVRANNSANEICHALDIADLPYIYLASRGLYLKPAIMDTVAYFKLLDNYHESPALYRILNLKIFNFNYKELVDLNFIAKKKAWSLFSALKAAEANSKLGKNTREKIEVVLSLIRKHTVLARERNVLEIFLAFLNDSGYLKHILELNEREKREILGHLNQFKKRIEKFEASSPDRSVKAFLEEFGLELDSGEEGTIGIDADAGPEAIKVMTVHAAKGLEFKYIFITGLVDKRFPTIERPDPIPLPTALIKEILPEGDIHLEEERRLFYVAITRAREGVYFSWAPDYGGKRKKKPSRFLTECGFNEKNKESENEAAPELIQKENKASIKKNPEETSLPIPSYFSHTQLSAFKNCPYQYKFAHILKIPRWGKYTLSFGQSMHLTLQKLFNLVSEKRGLGQASLFRDKDNKAAVGADKNLLSLDEIMEIYEQRWIDDWYEDENQKKTYKKLGRESLRGFYEKYKKNWPLTLSLEQGINLKIGGRRIFGKVDRIDDLGNDKIQIVDYKTGQPKKNKNIALENKEQLLIYQMAMEQSMPNKKISNLQFYYLNDNSELNFIGSGKDLGAMEEKIIERIKKIEKAITNNEFPAKPGILCKFCDFNSICEYKKS